MEIVKSLDNGVLAVALKGRLDTLTSATLTADLVEIEEAKDLVFDFKDLEYISSAGLRVILAYQKKLGGKEHVVIKNMNAVIRSVFQVTGFTRLVTIE